MNIKMETDDGKMENRTPKEKKNGWKTLEANPNSKSKPKLANTAKRRGVLKPGEQIAGQLTLSKYLELKTTAPKMKNVKFSDEKLNTFWNRAAGTDTSKGDINDDRGGKFNGTQRNTAANQ